MSSNSDICVETEQDNATQAFMSWSIKDLEWQAGGERKSFSWGIKQKWKCVQGRSSATDSDERDQNRMKTAAVIENSIAVYPLLTGEKENITDTLVVTTLQKSFMPILSTEMKERREGRSFSLISLSVDRRMCRRVNQTRIGREEKPNAQRMKGLARSLVACDTTLCVGGIESDGMSMTKTHSLVDRPNPLPSTRCVWSTQISLLILSFTIQLMADQFYRWSWMDALFFIAHPPFLLKGTKHTRLV